MNPAEETVGRQYVTFLVGGQLLGVEVLEVQEVLRDQVLTLVPLAPVACAGLINLRGQIVPAVEMRQLFQLPPRQAEENTFSVVVRTEHGVVSLQVDEVGDVVEVDTTALRPAPQKLDSSLRALLRGVHDITERDGAGTRNRLLLVLDKQQAVDVSGAQ